MYDWLLEHLWVAMLGAFLWLFKASMETAASRHFKSMDKIATQLEQLNNTVAGHTAQIDSMNKRLDRVEDRNV